MPERDLKVLLMVEGVDWYGWKTVEVTQQMDAVAGSFSLGLADKWEHGSEAIPLAAGLACELAYGDHPMINGYIGKFRPAFSATDHSITVSGRDKSADLVDCSAIHKPGHWQGLTLDQLAAILAEPFGVGVTVEGDVGEPFPSFKLEQGESVFEALDRACKQREILAMPDGAGNIVLLRVGSRKASTALVQGKNILSSSADFDLDDRYSDYIVQGQQPGNDDIWGDGAAAVSAGAKDPAVKRYRPFIVRAEDQVNASSAKARAEWECAVRAARAVSVDISVQGWLDGDALWAANSLVPVEIPYLRIEQELLIAKVVFSKGEQGTITKLTCRDPNAFLPEPKKKEAAAASGGGDSWMDLQEASASGASAAHQDIRG
jgi:prophage tail gpP-like protein